MEDAEASAVAVAAPRLESDEYSIQSSDSYLETTASPAPGAAENIAVCIRVRPLTEREERQRDVSVLRTVPKLQLISITDASGAPLPGKTNVFQYDHIFDAQSSTVDIYERVARRIVRSTLEGINGTIFAYGQTSSGKTYTMQGPLAAAAASSSSDSSSHHQAMDLSASPGILQLAVGDIFKYIEQCEDRDFLLRVSFVEIYNEVVRDLLRAPDKDASLKLREDPRKGVYVECKEEIITDYESILHLLHVGNQRRAVGQTAMNERSSRSHSIFRIVIESKRKSSASSKSIIGAAIASSSSSTRRTSDEDVNGAVLVASLSLVDLAGSESLRHTAAEGIRQREAGNINKSLLTLSRVINSLASAGDRASQNAPFRDSKLTRLLQNSLGGNTRTLIVCCVTPAERYLEETKSTLQFAARAKSIQISATVNEVLDDQAQLCRLKREVHELKKLVHSERDQYKAEIDDHKVKIDHLKSLILSSASMASKAAADKERLLDGRQRARSKRSRETWCPGDFPSSFKTRRLGSFDESPLSLKRLSADSKKSRLSSDVEEFHESEAHRDPSSARSSLQSDAAAQAHRRWVQLLTHALHHPDDKETAGLWESMANASGIESSDHIVKLQHDLQTVVSNCRATSQDENDRLRRRIEELEAASKDGVTKSRNIGDVATKSPEELARQLEEFKQAIAREQERYQALVEEKERSDEAMTTERDDLMQHLETLQSTIAEKESRWESEKQQLQASLEEVLAEVNELRSRISRKAGSDAASTVQELAKVKRQLKKSQMELARAREEQQRREELHQEALADVEAASKGSIKEYAEQLEDAYAEIDGLKLLKTQVVEQLETAFDKQTKELTAQLEEAQEAAHILEQELAALKSKKEAADRSPEVEQLLAEKQAFLDAKLGLEEQLERMTTRQSRLEQQIKAMGEDNSELQENVEELQCRADALLKENQQMQERQAKRPEVKTGLEDVSGELKEVLNELVQLRATIDSTEREKEDLADQNDRLAGELGDIKTLLVEKEHQVKVLHAQLDAKVMTISQLADKHAAEVAALKQETERLQMQLHDSSDAEAGGGDAGGDTGGLKDELVALTKRNAQLQEMLTSVLQESQKAAEERKQFQEAKTALVQELERAEEKKLQLEEDTALIMRQLQRSAAERQQYEEDAAMLEQRIREAEAGIQQFEEEAPAAAQFAAFKEESEADVLPTQVESVESDEESKPATDSHEDEDMAALISLRHAHPEKLRAESGKQEHSLSGMEQLVDKATKGLEDSEVAFVVAQMGRHRQEVEAAISSFQEELASSVAQRNELMEELRALEAQLMIESEEKMQLVVVADEQRAKLREAEEKLLKAEEKLAESLTLQQSMAAEADAAKRRLEEELERTREALQAATSTPSEASSAPVDGDEELRRQLAIQQQRRHTLELDVKSYEETLALLRHELTDSSHATAELLERLKAMEGELEAAAERQQSAEKEIKRLSTALERSDEEKVEMQRQMKQRLVATETRELALEEKLERLERGGKPDATAGEEQAALVAQQKQEASLALEQQLEEARDALAKREHELKQQLHQLQELQDKLSQSEINERVVREQVAALESHVRDQEAAAERRLAEAEAQWEQQIKDRGKQAALEVDGLREQLQEAQEELEGYQKYADDEIHRLRTLNEQAEAELALLATTHEKCGAREQELLKQVDEQEQWLARLKRKQHELQQTCDELDAARQAMRETHEQQVAQLQAGGVEELEELREALRASELEARHFHEQLVEAQLAQERAAERIETQQARIDKLEKVKMTNETLEVFRKLKSDRKALQETAAKLQRQLQEARDKRSAGGSQRVNEAATRELERSHEHLEELCAALRAEKQRTADMRAALKDEREKSAGEVDAMRELLRGKVAAAEQLAERVEQLELAYAALQQQQQQQQDKSSERPDNVSSLERENLELQFENRKLRGRLAGNQQGVEEEQEVAGGGVDKENERPVAGNDDDKAVVAFRHPALPASVEGLRREVDEKEQEDRKQQCAQQ